MTSLAAALLLAFSACSQDELSSPTGEVEEAVYPLKIGSVSIVAQSSEEPWTRVAENTTDGNSSVWETGDVIGVRFDGAPSYYGGTPPYTVKGEYVFQKTGEDLYLSFVAGKEIYWKNTYGINSQDKWDNKTWYSGGVTAWYPTDESVVLGDQSERLAYILEGHEKTPDNNGHYRPDDEIPLEFKHLLAKVRVELKGERATAVNKVEVYSYTSCTHSEVGPTLYTRPYRKISTDGAQQGWITMHNPTEYGNGMYWEANLVPGTIEANNFVRLNGTTVVPLSSLTELKAGNLHTVTVDVCAYPSDATQITAENAGNISGKGNYYVTGNLTSAINITGGSPHIYLYNANVTNSTGSAISITNGAKPTIHVVGANNSVSSKDGAGINVAKNATVTITGSSRSDVLTAQAGVDGAGIGGCYNDQDCGSINISNVTVTARGSGLLALSPGIGSTSANQCGQITIDNATVHAYGTGFNNAARCPAIGTGMTQSGAYGTTLPTVIIRNESEIHVHRGGNPADYIGYPYIMNVSTGAASAINLGTGGSVTNSTIYCYTGTSSTPDKTVVYDASGNGTEK